MVTRRFVAHWLIFITGLCGAASLMPILNFTHIAPPASLSCLLSHYSFPSIRSLFVEYLRYIWILLTRQQDHYSLQSRPAALITPRNLFLLVNLIIFLFASLHLQQHAAASKKQKRRIQLTESSINNHLAALRTLQRSSLTAGDGVARRGASMENLDNHSSLERRVHGRVEESCDEELASGSPVTGDRASMESSIGEAAPTEALLSYNPEPEFPASMAVHDTESISNLATSESSSAIGQGSGAAERDGIDGSNIVEKIVLEEDGRLRLIEEPSASSKTCTLETSENGNDHDQSDTNGSDCGKIVSEEDGRLRLVDRPQLPAASPCKPVEFQYSGDSYINHKDNDGNDEFNKCISPNNHNFNNNYTNLSNKLTGNYDISDNTKRIRHNCDIGDNAISKNNKIISNNYDIGDDTNDIISHNNYGFNKNYTNLSLVNYGENNSESHDLKQNGINSKIRQEAHRSKSSNVLLRKVSRPKVQKYESLDTTWRAINHSRDINAGSSRDQKPIISRQNSRHEFKPSSSSSRGLMQRGALRPPVRREPSLGPEELNSKVESFIARFNEQIRIQRQQSLLSYMQMVDRGA